MEEEELDQEAAEFKAMLEELVYISKHPKNLWKRREVALLLLGTFIEDISMYMVRHPQFNLLEELFADILQTNFDVAPKSLRSVLVGRSLWTCSQVSDQIPRSEEGADFIRSMIDLAIRTLNQLD